MSIHKEGCTHRRHFMRQISFALFGLGLARRTLGQRPSIELKVDVEETQSDFDTPSEVVTRREKLAFAQATPEDLKRFPMKPKQEIAVAILRRAERCAARKVNRATHKSEITQYLKLVDEAFSLNGKNVAFCAAGISFAACAAFRGFDPAKVLDSPDAVTDLAEVLPVVHEYYFRPDSSVTSIKEDAERRRTWVAESSAVSPRPGWLVVFSFKHGAPSHIGVVQSAQSENLRTVEFNTKPENAVGDERDGGFVATRNRTRTDGTVLGYIDITLSA